MAAAAVPDGRAPAVGPLPGFDEEFVLDAGDGQAVVVARLYEAEEVIACLRSQRREEHRLEHARRGIEHGHRVPRRRVGELGFGRFHRRAGDGLRARRAAAELFLQRAARQRKAAQERQHRQRLFIKTIHNSDLSVNRMGIYTEFSISYFSGGIEREMRENLPADFCAKNILTSGQKNATL